MRCATRLAAIALPLPSWRTVAFGSFWKGSHNCPLVASPTQIDTNLDGFGNLCDADLDAYGTRGNGVVGINDINAIARRFGLPAPGIEEFDLDASGAIGLADGSRAASLFGKPPGPSGYSCAGTAVPVCPVPVPQARAPGDRRRRSQAAGSSR
jgi:hypothetical protein